MHQCHELVAMLVKIFYRQLDKKCHATNCMDRAIGNGKLLSQTSRVALETLRSEVDQKHVYRTYEEIARSYVLLKLS